MAGGWYFTDEPKSPFGSGGSLRLLAFVALVIIVAAFAIKSHRHHKSFQKKHKMHCKQTRRQPKQRLGFSDARFLTNSPKCSIGAGAPRSKHHQDDIRNLLVDLADSLDDLSIQYGKSSMVKQTAHFLLELLIDVCAAAWLASLLSHFTGSNLQWVLDIVAMIAFVAAQVDEIWALQLNSFQEHELSVQFHRIFEEIQEKLVLNRSTEEELVRLYNRALERRDELIDKSGAGGY